MIREAERFKQRLRISETGDPAAAFEGEAAAISQQGEPPKATIDRPGFTANEHEPGCSPGTWTGWV